ALLVEHPDVDEAQALLGAVLADLGRDGEAGRQLDLLRAGDACSRSPAVTALAAEVAAALDSPEHAEALDGALAGHARAFAGTHGAISRHLGLVCHVLGRWDEAEEHFRDALEANRAAGAPVLVAHTRRHYAALLRARGEDGDWEQAIDLLALAATIYRRLDIGRLADEAEAVLRRSQDLTPADASGTVNVFVQTAAGWELGYGGQRATVADVAGLGHIATVLRADGRPVHALELVDGAEAGGQLACELRSRLEEVDAQLAEADPVTAALGRAEGDSLRAELADLGGWASTAAQSSSAEVGDRARRLVALRIRSALDRVEDALPDLARHLRRSVRTGTFCFYAPERPERWRVSR
nr:tetratricopeptide repeat protein [Actinomycetota bacterium]